MRLPRCWVSACSRWRRPSARWPLRPSRPRRHHASGDRGPRPPPGTRVRLRDRQLAGARHRQRPVPGAGHSAAATAATWAWRATGRAWGGCKTGNFLAWAPANADQANANYAKYHVGVGVGVYWYMGGPGVDPHWNGTTTEAYNWGERQAAWTLACDQGQVHPLPGDLGRHRAAGDRARAGQRLEQRLHLAVQRQGQAVLRARGRRPGGVQRVRGLHHRALHVQGRRLLGPDDLELDLRHRAARRQHPEHYEWTYQPETRSCRPRRPAGACAASSTCAQFFGGQTSASKYALMWQWSGGGGVTNGYGDFDQIDVARMK